MFQFFRIRLIRLHPPVLIGATLGLLGYIFDPFNKADESDCRSDAAARTYRLIALDVVASG